MTAPAYAGAVFCWRERGDGEIGTGVRWIGQDIVRDIVHDIVQVNKNIDKNMDKEPPPPPVYRLCANSQPKHQ